MPFAGQDAQHDISHADMEYILRQCEAYLRPREREELKNHLMAEYGPEPYHKGYTQILDTIESLLQSMYAQRRQEMSGEMKYRHFSILRPLSSCQRYLNHDKDCMTSLSTLILEGEREYGSLETFFGVNEGAPNPNIELGYQYYCGLYRDRHFEEVEHILGPYISAVQRMLGPSNPVVLGCVRLLAELLAEVGRFEQANAVMQDVWSRIGTMKGADMQHKQDEIDEWHAVDAFIKAKRAGNEEV